MNNTRVLLVDDDPVILKFVGANLKARNFDVTTAEDGESALKAMEQTLPDLVILDIMMPGMDGVEVCRRIREWSRVPVIMLTARSQTNDIARANSCGIEDYIVKPFDLSELLEKIESIVESRKAVAR